MKRVHFYQGLTEMQLCVGPELCQCVPAASPAFFLVFFFGCCCFVYIFFDFFSPGKEMLA